MTGPVSKRCEVTGCDRPHKARGLCMHHYAKARSAGAFTPRQQARAGLPDRDRLAFIGWDVDSNDCWNWRGSILNGYGRLGRMSRSDGEVLAHRAAYSAYVGEVPDGMFVHHTCANRRCVNPDHLELTTARMNMGEMMERRFYVRRIASLEAEVANLRGRPNVPQALPSSPVAEPVDDEDNSAWRDLLRSPASEARWTPSEVAQIFGTSVANVVRIVRRLRIAGEVADPDVESKASDPSTAGQAVESYDRDTILAIGYRVRTPQAIRLRQQATAVLRDYLIKGFALDDRRLGQTTSLDTASLQALTAAERPAPPDEAMS